MTVIAWDGKTLAVDRRLCSGDIFYEGTKLHILDDGTAIAWCGTRDQALELIDWYQNGQEKEKWPEFQNTNDWTQLVIVKPDGTCWILCQRPFLMPIETKFLAWGSGCEIAMGAMASGKNAIESVDIASTYSITCGNGVDYYEVSKCHLKKVQAIK